MAIALIGLELTGGQYVIPGPALVHERQILDIHGFFQDEVDLLYDTNLLVLIGISTVQLISYSKPMDKQNMRKGANNLGLTFILTFFHTFVA